MEALTQYSKYPFYILIQYSLFTYQGGLHTSTTLARLLELLEHHDNEVRVSGQTLIIKMGAHSGFQATHLVAIAHYLFFKLGCALKS
jgi:hypothetical protein